MSCSKKGYANAFSTLTAPTKANVNEYFPINNIDTSDWKLDGDRLYCKNPGTWNIILQYQLVGLQLTMDEFKVKNYLLSGFINKNGIDVEFSSATGVTIPNIKNVLTISYTDHFNCNDYFKIGIHSSTIDGVINDKPNIICDSYIGISGLIDPSIIATLTLFNKA